MRADAVLAMRADAVLAPNRRGTLRLPLVLFPSGHGSRAARRLTLGRRLAFLWKLPLLAVAMAGLTSFLWRG